MGCDIHLYVEGKDNTGRWWKLKDRFRSDMYDPNDKYFSQDRLKYSDSPYSGRNYVLFSYLADVRNGYGFAGIDTGDRIVPFDDPRGLPEDVSLTLQDESEYWGIDGHSHSYFTLDDLIEAEERARETTIIKRGVVSAEQYMKYKAEGSPSSWSGDITGGGIKKVTNNQMETHIKNGDTERVYTKIEWQTSLYEYTQHFWEHVIPQLKDVLDEYEDVRIVFWFDN